MAEKSFAAQLRALREKIPTSQEEESELATAVPAEEGQVQKSPREEFRERLMSVATESVETPGGTVEQENFQKDSPFNREVNGKKEFINAKEARTIFKEILKEEENFPPGVVNHLLVNYVDPISRKINRLTPLIKEAKGDDKEQLIKSREHASNSLQLAMRSILEDPSIFDIDPADFDKKTAELTIEPEELKNRIEYGHPFPFHKSGRMLPMSEIKKLSALLIDQAAEQYEDDGKKIIAGQLKNNYLNDLFRQMREAGRLGDEKNPVGARIKRMQEMEDKFARFLRDLSAKGGVKKYGLSIVENGWADETAAELFPRLALRPAQETKNDPEACRKFYDELVSSYTPEELKELEDKYKYGDPEETLIDAAGIKQLRHLRAEAGHLLRQDDVVKALGERSEEYIAMIFNEELNPTMDRIAGLVQELIKLKEDGYKKNKDAIDSKQAEINASYVDIQTALQTVLVNPRAYKLMHPLSTKEGDGVVIEELTEDISLESDFEYRVANALDRDQRIAAFKVFRNAHVGQLENMTEKLGDNARAAVGESEEFKAFKAAMDEFKKLVLQAEFSDEDVQSIPGTVEAVQDAYDNLVTYLSDNFTVEEIEDNNE